MFERKQTAGDDLATFRLADLVKLYTDRILQLGVTDPSGNSTKLREQIMHHAPKLGVELDCFKQGSDYNRNNNNIIYYTLFLVSIYIVV